MSIQGGINQLLGMGADVTKRVTQAAAEKYAAKRGAELDKSYQANVEAAKTGYTKSGAVSHSKAAEAARAKVEETTPGAGSKAHWNKEAEAQQKAEYDKKMGKLTETVNKGVAGLKETKNKAQESAEAQLTYTGVTPEQAAAMRADDRWKVKAEQRIMQRNAFADFMKSLEEEGK